QFCFGIREQRRHMVVKLPRNVLRSRRKLPKSRIVLVKKFVIEKVTHNFAGTLLDFADVNQHSRGWIDGTGEDKISNVIAAAAITRIRFGAERGRVLLVGPSLNVQSSRS